ncbi:hypothetical protein CDL15_Pgr016868 [Punica granatum]|uniref:Uncharacterized protein n=1 Tax=Punica granatum TaxID=22663 RepID=A0A218WZ14_PUNGR|nr:hypothetical protein CDL15_Pgr016868 [Punica granatum]
MRRLDIHLSCHEIIQASRGRHLHGLASHYGRLDRGIPVPLLSHFFPGPPHIVRGTLDTLSSDSNDAPVALLAIYAITEETPSGIYIRLTQENEELNKNRNSTRTRGDSIFISLAMRLFKQAGADTSTVSQRTTGGSTGASRFPRSPTSFQAHRTSGRHLHRLAAHYGRLDRGIPVPPLSHFFPGPPHIVRGTLDSLSSDSNDALVALLAIYAITEETPSGIYIRLTQENEELNN